MAEWIGGNRYLTMAQMQVNAKNVWDYFGSYGATLNAVAGMLGNMQSESNINPNIWQSLKPNVNNGYGLTQWTPATKLINWSPTLYTSGTEQCRRIAYEAREGLQWFRNPNAPIVDPPISFAEFLKSNEAVATLANYFLWYYEHPKVTIQPKRAEQAEYWYEFLSGVAPEPPPEPTPVISFGKMNIIYYGRKF